MARPTKIDEQFESDLLYVAGELEGFAAAFEAWLYRSAIQRAREIGADELAIMLMRDLEMGMRTGECDPLPKED